MAHRMFYSKKEWEYNVRFAGFSYALRRPIAISAAVALKIRNILLFHALYFGSDVKGNFGF